MPNVNPTHTPHPRFSDQRWCAPHRHPPGDIRHYPATCSAVTAGARGVLSPSKQRQRMLVNRLQHTGQPPAKNFLAPNDDGAEVDKCHSGMTHLLAPLILITLGWKPGQCPHSPPNLSLHWGAQRQTDTPTIKQRKRGPKRQVKALEFAELRCCLPVGFPSSPMSQHLKGVSKYFLK